MDNFAGRVTLRELEPLGLSEAERVVYEALVDEGSATTADLHRATRRNQGGLRGILNSLEAKGLVSRVPGRPVRYTPVPPDVGLELLFGHREEELRRARLAALDLSERFQQAQARRDVSGLVEIVGGERAVRARYSAIHRTARQQLRVMSRPPYVQTSEETRTISIEAHEKRVRVRNIIDPRYFESEAERRLASIREDIANGEEYRQMGNAPLKLIVADDRAALIPLEIRSQGIQSALLFHASAFLEALIEVFETCWALAYPLDVLGELRDDRIRSPEAVSTDERELLVLLAAGIPDDVIARSLDVSHTTVQRRIRALKTRLGAITRFQAGLQAALRGWITDAGAPDRRT